MSETKLYGTRLEDGSIVQRAEAIHDKPSPRGSFMTDGTSSVEIVAVSADRLRALESLVRAADRMRSAKRRHWSSDFHETQESFDAATNAMNDYDTQRAAVGEIGEE